MRRTLAMAIALSVSLSAGGVAAADDPIETLQRTSNWEIQYDDDVCSLITQFGSGDQEVTAAFKRYQPGDAFDLTLYGKRFGDAPTHADAKLDFGIGPTLRRDAIGGHLDKTPITMFLALRLDGWDRSKHEERPQVSPAQEAAVSGVTVGIPGAHRFRLDTGSLAKPFAALRACQADLLRHWGFDPDVQAHLSHPAHPQRSPQSWVGTNDYPDGKAVAGVNALVEFRLDVDPMGGVTACHILYRTNGDAFADTTCRILSARARFDPALDEQGRPVRSYFIGRILWNARRRS